MESLATPVSALGRLLREWRRARGFSQLELALAAGISGRHLSFVETGRAQPGRDVVLRLASALGLPLRDRNAALGAAGYAPIYGQASLHSPEMAPVTRAIEFILRQQEPYPAIVMTRLGMISHQNAGGGRFLSLFLPGAPPGGCAAGMNLYRLVLAPGFLHEHIVNWEEVARHVVLRLRGEVAAMPGDRTAHLFLEEMLAQPGLPDDCQVAMPEASALPVVPTEFRLGDRRLKLFHTITTVGTPRTSPCRSCASSARSRPTPRRTPSCSPWPPPSTSGPPSDQGALRGASWSWDRAGAGS